MSKRIRNRLIEIARLRATTTYSQISEQLEFGLDLELKDHREMIFDWLNDVSLDEHKKGRPLLGVLVSKKNGRREANDGFYRMCEELYGKKWETMKDDEGWEEEQKAACHEFWLNEENYEKYKADY